ncbi:MAG: prepilin peptidase [Kineosporiaceae bacterium]|nr:prepilin peptidase [Aeromicrobium sp.]
MSARAATCRRVGDVVAVWAAVVGALIGSFLNVVIYRVPLKRSIISPASACGACGARVRAYDNIPVISWLALRGRCRDCGSRISVRYPLVELGGAAFFAAVTLRFLPEISAASTASALGASIVGLAAFLYLAAVSIALALIDLDTHRIPNVIVLPAYIVGLLMLGLAAILGGDYASLLLAGTGCLAMGLAYLVMAVAYPGGMGFGDVKLAGVLGLFLGWLGWAPLAVGASLAFLLGGIFGVVVMLIRRGGRKTAIPFGPWMLAGAWLGIFVGAPLSTGYLSLFGLE